MGRTTTYIALATMGVLGLGAASSYESNLYRNRADCIRDNPMRSNECSPVTGGSHPGGHYNGPSRFGFGGDGRGTTPSSLGTTSRGGFGGHGGSGRGG